MVDRLSFGEALDFWLFQRFVVRPLSHESKSLHYTPLGRRIIIVSFLLIGTEETFFLYFVVFDPQLILRSFRDIHHNLKETKPQFQHHFRDSEEKKRNNNPVESLTHGGRQRFKKATHGSLQEGEDMLRLSGKEIQLGHLDRTNGSTISSRKQDVGSLCVL